MKNQSYMAEMQLSKPPAHQAVDDWVAGEGSLRAVSWGSLPVDPPQWCQLRKSLLGRAIGLRSKKGERRDFPASLGEGRGVEGNGRAWPSNPIMASCQPQQDRAPYKTPATWHQLPCLASSATVIRCKGCWAGETQGLNFGLRG